MLSLAVDGNLVPSLQEGGTAVLLKMQGHSLFEYGGLHSVDSAGHTVPSRMNVENGQIRLIVDDTDAVYPLTIDPTVIWKQYSEGNAPDAASTDQFGYSMSISSDGNRIVVGAYNKTVNGNPGQGAVYLFYVPSLTLIQEYTAPDGAAEITSGNQLAISAPSWWWARPIRRSTGAGRARCTASGIRDDPGTTPQIFTASDGAAGDHFGSSVATVYSDGPNQYVLAGAPGRNSSQGAVYFISGPGDGNLNGWAQRQTVVASDGTPGDEFGASLSVGLFTMAVGAPGKSINNKASQGKAYAYSLGSNTVSPITSVVAPDGAAGDRFGDRLPQMGLSASLLVHRVRTPPKVPPICLSRHTVGPGSKAHCARWSG